MRILIDLTSLADNFSGIERFALCITKELLNNSLKNNLVYILLFKNKIHEEFLTDLPNVKKIVLNGRNKLLFNQIVLPSALQRIKADYYFFPAFPAPFFFFNRNAVSVIHDLGCWDCPDKNKKHMVLYFKLMYWKAAYGIKKVITVSQFSKGRISTILKKEKSDIIVIYNGISHCFKNFQYDERLEKKAIRDYGLPSEYILCLSTIEPRKNMSLLVKAYDQLLQDSKINFDLVLAGRKGWLVEDLLSGLSKNTIERIHFTGFVDDELLPYVYKQARFFVFPSMYEGFGVPPIEAMSMGIPVISSDAASLPEILGSSAVFFENNNIESLKAKIIEVLQFTDTELEKRIVMGIARAKEYSWREEALKLRKYAFINK